MQKSVKLQDRVRIPTLALGKRGEMNGKVNGREFKDRGCR